MTQLNQVVAVSQGKKTQATDQLTSLYHILKKGDLFSGMTRTYIPLDADDADILDPEDQVVQKKVSDCVDQAVATLIPWIDVVATQETANCEARGEVKTESGFSLGEQPIAVLLFLEKRIEDLKAFVKHIPTLDPSQRWEEDSNTGLWKTQPIQKRRMTKTDQPIVLYDATPEHPAQTQVIKKDVLVGHFHEIKFSGAINGTKKRELLSRLTELSDAVKKAREEANTRIVENVEIGEKILGYVFDGI